MTKIKELEVRQAIGWAYPYEAAWKAGGEIDGSDPGPGHRDPAARAPPVARSTTRPATSGKDHRPGQGEGAAEEGRLRAGRVRDQVPVRDRRRPRRRREERDRQGTGGRRLQGHPDRLDLRDDPHRPHRLQVADQRPLQRMVLGLAVRHHLVPGSVGRQPGRPRGHAEPVELQGQAAMDDEQDKILDTMTPEEALPAWGEFDETMETEVLPRGQHRLLAARR